MTNRPITRPLDFSMLQHCRNNFNTTFNNQHSTMNTTLNTTNNIYVFSRIHSGPKKSKKSRQKKTCEINFFSWNCIFGTFKLFPSSKIDFRRYLKLQKMEFGQNKIIREIDLFDFTSFLDWTFLNFVAHCVCVHIM